MRYGLRFGLQWHSISRRARACRNPLIAILVVALTAQGGPGTAAAVAAAGFPQPAAVAAADHVSENLGTELPAHTAAAPVATATPAGPRQASVAASARASAAGSLGNLKFITPVRVLDTRTSDLNGTGPIGAQAGGCSAVAAQQVPAAAITRFQIGGCAFSGTAFPADLSGLLLNVTIVQAQASGGFVTVVPGDQTSPPGSSTVNPSTAVAANFWSVGVPTSGANRGQIGVFSSNQLDVLLDVVGYFALSNPAGPGNLTLITPTRVIDTRAAVDNGTGPIGFDGASGNSIGAAPIQPGGLRVFRLAGTSFANATTFPADLSGVLAHVTVVQAQASGGFTTLLPGDAAGRPNTSTVNPSTAVAFNGWAVGVPTNGNVAVFSTNQTDVIVDVVGYYSPSTPAAGGVGDLTLIPPTRVLDTRPSSPPGIITTGFQPNGTPIAAGPFSPGGSGETRRYLVAGKSFGFGANAVTFPADITGVLVNVTLVQAQASGGFVTLFPGSVFDANRPNASTVNPSTAVAASFWASAVAPTGQGAGQFALFSTNAADVIVDVVGYFRPAPVSITAPPVDRTVATSVYSATAFVYSGPNPIQTGIIAGTIVPTRTSGLRGVVLDRAGLPRPGTTVTVLGHPEYGQTVSRSDGQWDMVVNGGGPLALNFAAPDAIPLQRTVDAVWQSWLTVPDVRLSPLDPNVSTINLTSGTVQVARGSTITDSDGTRRDTLLFLPGTTAVMSMTNGTTQPLPSTIHIRATEYTIGVGGMAAMPGDLPVTSQYTQATEFTVDEALAAGAIGVGFSQPVVTYLENFLGFPVGTSVPAGFYDKQNGVWVADQSGLVVKVLGVSGGLARLDVTGGGTEATAAQYAAIGITAAEQAQVAQLYTAGQTLWRTPLRHFSAWDKNWGWGPPADAQAPKQPKPAKPRTDQQPDCDDCWKGSIVDAQRQRLGEYLPLTGAPFGLNYESDRVPDRLAAYTLDIPLTVGGGIPASLKRVEVAVVVAGRAFTYTAPSTTPNQIYRFTWDGKDAFGRALQGQQPVKVDVGYVYDGSYQQTSQFGFNGNGVPITGNKTRMEVVLHQRTTTTLGGIDARSVGLGGWTLDVHHMYDPTGQMLYEGNGVQRAAASVGRIITTVAGPTVPDGAPPAPAPAANPSANAGEFAPVSADSAGGTAGGRSAAASIGPVVGVAAARDGTVYFNDTSTPVIRAIRPDGTIAIVAGTGTSGFSPDGTPATQAQLSAPTTPRVTPDGGLIFWDSGNRRIRKIGADGKLVTVAGNGQAGYGGENVPATQASLDNGNLTVLSLVMPDGTFYFAENFRVRRIGPDGLLKTVAGTGTAGYNGDNIPATRAQLNGISEVTAGADGSIYIGDTFNFRIRRVGPDGIITTFAGNGTNGSGGTGDGGPATQAALQFGNFAPLNSGTDMTVDADGALLFSERTPGIVRRVGPEGIVSTVFGSGTRGFSGDGGPTLAAQLTTSDLAAAPDGSVYIADQTNRRVRRVQPPLPGLTATDFTIPSTDGGLLYRFNGAGRHLSTADTYMGAVRWSFGYDGAGRLVSATDGDGNATTIQRDVQGTPTAIVGPYGQTTQLQLDANEFLSRVTDPDGQFTQLASSAGGLLQTLTDRRGLVHQFTYDALGRLNRDQGLAGNAIDLTRSTNGTTSTSTLTTAQGRATTYTTGPVSTGGQIYTTLDPAGLLTSNSFLPNGTGVLTSPTGLRTTDVQQADPRFGMQAPLTGSRQSVTPANLTDSRTFSRTATLANASDPLSLTQLTETFTHNGRTATTAYTAANRTFTTTLPTGRTLSTTVDTQHRPAQSQLGNLLAVTRTYDARGRLATVSQGSGGGTRTTTYAYATSGPAAGFLQSITDALDRTWTQTRDSLGRLTQLTRPDAQSVTFAYDAMDNVTSLTPPGRPAHAFAYTPDNRLQAYTAPSVTGGGTNQTSYTYTQDRQLATMTRADGISVSYAYDAAARPTGTTITRGTVTTGYNPTTGNIASFNAPGGVNLAFTYDGDLPTGATLSGPVSGSVTRTFDTSFRRQSDSVNGANTVSYTYDNDDLLTAAGALNLTRNAQTGLVTAASVGGTQSAYTYNGFGELTGATVTQGVNTLYSLTLTYDNLGRILTKAELFQGGGAVNWTYTYDTVGRLASAQQGAFTTNYTYDANGNRDCGVTTAYDAQDRLLACGASTYSYTPQGELASKTAAGQTTSYQYDELGNLLQVVLGAGGGSPTTVAYLVDGGNRRVARSVNGVRTQGWLWDDQLRIVAELDAGNAVVSRFVYGERANVPEYMLKNGSAYRLVHDQLGSVRLVVDTNNGNVVQRLDYDAWGNVVADTNPGFQPFGFAGGLYDPQTKLTRFGARDYDAETGRWTTKDPLGFDGNDTNLYAYVGNDPINQFDPSGRFPVVYVAVIIVVTLAGVFYFAFQRKTDCPTPPPSRRIWSNAPTGPDSSRNQPSSTTTNFMDGSNPGSPVRYQSGVGTAPSVQDIYSNPNAYRRQ